MSGICGAVDWSGQGEDGLADDLGRMLERLSHLGPDGAISYREPGLALGQLLDYQTPESTGVTRVVRDDGSGVSLIADLRLDNREALGEKLELAEALLAETSDEALLLLAYGRWGIDLVEHLLGDFFFAFWSTPERRLWLVRDAMGIRPGCYARLSQGLVFASEVNAILACETVGRTPCIERIADFLALDFEDLETTFYERVMRVPPGTVVEAGPERFAKRRYWRLEFTPELRLRDNREYADAFRELLVDSVKRRLRTRVPTGFLLSGGLDSSCIVGIAQQCRLPEGQGALRTFSALFPDYPLIDEREWIDLVLATGEFAPSFVRVDHSTPLGLLEREVAAHGEPFFSPNNYLDSALLDCAQQAGTRLVLDGLDGDTAVGHGWELLGELFRRGKWRGMWQHARRLDHNTDRSALWFLWRHALAPTAAGLWNLARSGFSGHRPAIMNRDFARRTGWADRKQEVDKHWSSLRLSGFRRQHWGLLTSGLMPSMFEIAARQAGLRGMGRRHPYFDRRLVEFCVSLPADQRLNKGFDRVIQRRAAEGLVPEKIRFRLSKSIWVDNFRDRLRQQERTRVETWLGRRNSAAAEFIDLKELETACRAALRKGADERFLTEVWLAHALDAWLAAPHMPNPGAF